MRKLLLKLWQTTLLTFWTVTALSTKHQYDDTTVIIKGQNYNNLILTLNTELIKLDVWLQANKMTLNTAKTHDMVFHRARIKCKSGTISIRNNVIAEVKSTKFSGIINDDKLK